jgi:hypothetical protein
MDHFERLVDAARTAESILLRVGSEGGIADQIERGEWNRSLTQQQAVDLADLLSAMSEQVRHTRAVAGGMAFDPPLAHSNVGSLDSVLSERLPLNRKERFYTGTVLPMIIGSDGFAHLHRFLALCGLQIEPLDDHALDGNASIEFFTEYNFAESRFTPADVKRFPDAPTDADTPDLVIVGPDWLVAVEAKVFHNPPSSALNEQMRRQRVLVDYWVGQLDIPADRVAHVLVLPSKLPIIGVNHVPVTWESVLEAYQVVGPRYWISMLQTAINRYEELRSRGTASFGANADGHMTGAAILEAHGLGELEYAYMGRNFGLEGSDLRRDLSTGEWRTRRYEVRFEPLPENPKWFAIADFIAKTAH